MKVRDFKRLVYVHDLTTSSFHHGEICNYCNVMFSFGTKYVCFMQHQSICMLIPDAAAVTKTESRSQVTVNKALMEVTQRFMLDFTGQSEAQCLQVERLIAH